MVEVVTTLVCSRTPYTSSFPAFFHIYQVLKYSISQSEMHPRERITHSGYMDHLNKRQTELFSLYKCCQSVELRIQQLSKTWHVSKSNEIMHLCSGSWCVHFLSPVHILSRSTFGIHCHKPLISFCSLPCNHGGHPGQDIAHRILSGYPEN